MRIVALEPFLAELLASFDVEKAVVGVSHRTDYPDTLKDVARITTAGADTHPLFRLISPDRIKFEELRALEPEIIVTTVADPERAAEIRQATEIELIKVLGREIKLFVYHPRTLEQVFETFLQLAKDVGVPAKGRELVQHVRAQLMDWSDNFYDRMKNKKITFLSSLEPFRLAGLWIPEMIHLASASSQNHLSGEAPLEVKWEEIVRFRPDVIVVAPQDLSLKEALKSFKRLEKLPDWESIPAVKRGEVIFTDGVRHFYRPSQLLRESMGILISAIAGLESGYITARDCFYKLRWLEMQRHRLEE